MTTENLASLVGANIRAVLFDSIRRCGLVLTTYQSRSFRWAIYPAASGYAECSDQDTIQLGVLYSGLELIITTILILDGSLNWAIGRQPSRHKINKTKKLPSPLFNRWTLGWSVVSIWPWGWNVGVSWLESKITHWDNSNVDLSLLRCISMGWTIMNEEKLLIGRQLLLGIWFALSLTGTQG